MTKEKAKTDQNQKLTLKYVPLSSVVLWDRNNKKHDLETLERSFRKYGFKDPLKFEPTLNEGKGGIVEGNGRGIVLSRLRERNEEPPRGILVDGEGEWLIPVLFGVDAESKVAAEAYAIDHNNLTLGGAGFSLSEMMRIWEDDVAELLNSIPQEEYPVSLEGHTPEEIFVDLTAFQRPKFDGLFDQVKDQKKGEGSDKDGNWFFFEFYGNDEIFQRIKQSLKERGMMKTDHEIKPAFAASLILGADDPLVVGFEDPDENSKGGK